MRLLLWWLLPDSNWGHKALQASALPTELKSRNETNLRFFSSLVSLADLQAGKLAALFPIVRR